MGCWCYGKIKYWWSNGGEGEDVGMLINCCKITELWETIFLVRGRPDPEEWPGKMMFSQNALHEDKHMLAYMDWV